MPIQGWARHFSSPCCIICDYASIVMYVRLVPRQGLGGVGWPPLEQGVAFVNGQSVGRNMPLRRSRSRSSR
jgi:hypothetical protein